MFIQQPQLSDLFVQLGLDASEPAIDKFIEEHKGLNKSRHIEDAPFWNDSQSQFLQQALAEDAQWAEVIDELNVRLH